MSVYIKDMKMPKRCEDCPFREYEQGQCTAYRDLNTLCKTGDKPEWCPLVEVPTPHGDLIDIDRALNVLLENYDKYDLEDVIATAPAIIEAEETKNAEQR